MKTIKILIPALLLLVISCTKETSYTESVLEKAYYRILAIGKDTTFSRLLAAKEQSIDSVDQDDYLKIKMIGYSAGKYYLAVTNKQTCQADIEIKYEGLQISAISPNPKNNLNHNYVAANATQIFELTGASHVGHVKVQALTICNWMGEHPKWLKVDAVQSILPITFISTSIDRIDKQTVVIKFEIDAPQDIDYLLIQRSIEGKVFNTISTIPSDGVTKFYSKTITQ